MYIHPIIIGFVLGVAATFIGLSIAGKRWSKKNDEV